MPGSVASGTDCINCPDVNEEVVLNRKEIIHFSESINILLELSVA